MITKESINQDNWAEMRRLVAKERENRYKQGEALADTRVLREFAKEKMMTNEVMDLFLEEALVWQHIYMADKNNKVALEEMKKVVEEAESYAIEKSIITWQSRIARFMGRVLDYEESYTEALKQYEKAVELVASDPGYENNKAMVFEYYGFMALDNLRLGKTEEGMEMGEKLYLDYENSNEGKDLKAKDYGTWAIWRSGLMINMCRGVIETNKKEAYRQEIENWLERAEKDLELPEGVNSWADFSIRKAEVAEIRKLLQ